MGWQTAVDALTRFRGGDGPSEPQTAWGGWFTVVGAVIGAALGISAAAAVWLGGNRAGIVIACLAVLLVEVWLTSGRGYIRVITWLERVAFSNRAEVAVYVRVALFQGILMLKVAAFGLLAATGMWTWFVVAYALAAARVWSVAQCDAEVTGRSSRAWGWVPARVSHWIVAAIVALAAAWFSGALLTGVAALIASWIVPQACRPFAAPARGRSDLDAVLVWEVVLLTVLVMGGLRALAG